MIKKHIPVLVVGLLIVLVALAGGAVYGINKLIPSRKQMDLTEYYGQNADGEAALILGTEKLEEKALISGEDVYLPLDVVNGYLNQRYYWDSENKKILYSLCIQLLDGLLSMWLFLFNLFSGFFPSFLLSPSGLFSHFHLRCFLFPAVVHFQELPKGCF